LREKHRLRVFENTVLRRIFGPKRNEVTGEWRRLHKKELYALYSSLNTIRVVKSRRMRWAGNIARIGERRGAYWVLVGKPEGRRTLERLRYRWEENIKLSFEKWNGGMNWIELDQGTERWRGLCECGNESSGSIKCGEVLDWLNTCQLLSKNSTPWSYLVSQSVSQSVSMIQVANPSSNSYNNLKFLRNFAKFATHYLNIYFTIFQKNKSLA
jgi:hypothetical protein